MEAIFAVAFLAAASTASMVFGGALLAAAVTVMGFVMAINAIFFTAAAMAVVLPIAVAVGLGATWYGGRLLKAAEKDGKFKTAARMYDQYTKYADFTGKKSGSKTINVKADTISDDEREILDKYSELDQGLSDFDKRLRSRTRL